MYKNEFSTTPFLGGTPGEEQEALQEEGSGTRNGHEASKSSKGLSGLSRGSR